MQTITAIAGFFNIMFNYFDFDNKNIILDDYDMEGIDQIISNHRAVNPDQYLWDLIKQDIQFEIEWDNLRHCVIDKDHDKIMAYASNDYASYLRTIRLLTTILSYEDRLNQYDYLSPYAKNIVEFASKTINDLHTKEHEWFNKFHIKIEENMPIYLSDVNAADILSDYIDNYTKKDINVFED